MLTGCLRQGRVLGVVLGFGLGWLVGSQLLPAQAPPDQALLLLNSARKAYNEGQYEFAAARFREFLQRFGGHKEAPQARYGLALVLLEAPDKRYAEARDLLQGLAGNPQLPEYPQVLYHLGLAVRGLGVEELKQAAAKPMEATTHQNQARQRFEEAARHFAAAARAFAERAPAGVSEKSKSLPPELEWAARARCDQAEMLVRAGKLAEARTAAELFREPVWAQSRYAPLGRYYYGLASYLLGDYAAAQKSLSLLAPFEDPVFGIHARYLLARTHHQAGERAEAATQYQGVLQDYAKHKQQAAETLRLSGNKLSPAERARLETLANGPPPEHVSRAAFYLGVLDYEAGRFAEAAARFQEVLKQTPPAPLQAETRLRLGMCQVQLHEYPQAQQILQPLAEREPALADRAWFWLAQGKMAQAAEAAQRSAQEQLLREALDLLRKAAEAAGRHPDPQARQRRGDILLASADVLAQLGQHREAAQSYQQLLHDKLPGQRPEELLYRLATAWQLAGDYEAADKACRQFLETYPKSPLLPYVLFRFAENSYFRSQAADKAGKAGDRLPFLEEAIRRYQNLLQRFAEFPQVNQARYGLALAYYQKGDLENAQKTLEAIPAAERQRELARVNYLLAHCLLRQAPATPPEDALAAGKLEEQLKTAAELFEAYLLNQPPQDPQVPEALLQLGLCQQRRAALLAEPAERQKLLQAARNAYERLLGTPFAKHPAQGHAFLERAKCLVQLGDVGGALNELRRFQHDPWQQSAVAPLGLIYLAQVLRQQHKPAEAAEVLARARERYENELSRQPERARWALWLRYHHGLALREAGKLPEARALFEQLLKQAPAGSLEAQEAALRYGQCLKEEGQLLVHGQGLKPNASLEEKERQRAEGQRLLQQAAQFLQERAAAKGQAPPELRARLWYEIAWAWRELAQAQREAQQALVKNSKEKKGSAGPSPAPSAEEKAVQAYRTLLNEFPDLPLALEARFELAEWYTLQGRNAEAVQLLNEGLDREPAAELAAKMRLRLGVALAARGDVKGALAHFEALAQEPKNPLAAQARYRAAECFLQIRQWAEAVQRLRPFRDQPDLQQVPGISDRALLRLGQAYAHLGDWNQSRQTLETLLQRYPHSPWVHEARYGIAWAWQEQKNYDQAVAVYQQVTAATIAEIAAKAQLQIGRCRLAQKRSAEAANALLVVPFTYDYPEWNAVALLEAAQAFQELRQPAQARRLLQRLLRDHPDSPWAEAARKRLAELPES